VDAASKKDEEEKPVGSAYTPVSLPAPKRLRNPFAAFEQQQPTAAAPALRSSVSVGGAKKLTWSERQALAKKQAEEEEARSRTASFVPPASAPVVPNTSSSAPTFGRATAAKITPRNFGAVGAVAAGVAVGAGASRFAHSVGDGAGREELVCINVKTLFMQ
jgi:hypothetical protein